MVERWPRRKPGPYNGGSGSTAGRLLGWGERLGTPRIWGMFGGRLRIDSAVALRYFVFAMMTGNEAGESPDMMI